MAYEEGDLFPLSLRAVDKSLAVGHRGVLRVISTEQGEGSSIIDYVVEDIVESGYQCRVVKVTTATASSS